MEGDALRREGRIAIWNMELKNAKQILTHVREPKEVQYWEDYIKKLETLIFEIEVLGRDNI